MKKLIVALLSISILIGTSGCIKAPAAPTTEPDHSVPVQSVPTEATEQTLPAVLPDLPLLVFSAPAQTREHYAKDGTLLFSYTYQNFSLILEDPQIADAIAIDLMNLVDFENSSAKMVLSDAQDAYESDDVWSPFAYSALFQPERFDAGILSLSGVHAVYNGTPRATTTGVSVTYDLVSGRQLALNDIFLPDYSADTLSQLITAALSPLSEKGLLFSDYAYVVSELFTTNRPVDSWYLSETGLCFYFAPYEIAPYSSGTITAEVPYADLTGILKEEYFPGEKSELSGKLYIQPFADMDLDQFEQFAELYMEGNGQQLILYTDGCLQDLRVEQGSWLEDGSFAAEATVFSAATLCSGDGIVLHAQNDTIDQLRVSYKDNGNIVYKSITEIVNGQ